MSDAVKAPQVAALKAKLEAEKAALEAELAPFRAFYEQHVNDPKYLEAKVKIREINAKLAPIGNELAALARVSGAKNLKIESGHYDKQHG